MPTITTYDEMDEKLVEGLRVFDDFIQQYAAQRIEELESEVERLEGEHAELVSLVRRAGNRLRDYDEHDAFCGTMHDYLERIGIKPKISREAAEPKGAE